jgi:hypothetical protein
VATPGPWDAIVSDMVDLPETTCGGPHGTRRMDHADEPTVTADISLLDAPATGAAGRLGAGRYRLLRPVIEGLLGHEPERRPTPTRSARRSGPRRAGPGYRRAAGRHVRIAAGGVGGRRGS